MKNTQKLVHDMLMHNTGIAMMDSGGDSGRHWQRNAKIDPATLPEVDIELPDQWYTLKKAGQFMRRDKSIAALVQHMAFSRKELENDGYTFEKESRTSDDIEYTVSLYHYLPQVLELDALCTEFNSMPVKDWDCEDAYGVSSDGAKWLKSQGFTFSTTWNSYNGENVLSQTLQGTELKKDGLGEGDYLLLQVHGGADVRGGYTDAKLFKYIEFQSMVNPCPHVSATLTRKDGTQIELSSGYHGYKLSGENGEVVDIMEGDTIEANLCI